MRENNFPHFPQTSVTFRALRPASSGSQFYEEPSFGPELCLRSELAYQSPSDFTSCSTLVTRKLFLDLSERARLRPHLFHSKNVHGPIWLSLDNWRRSATGKMFFGIFALSSPPIDVSSAQGCSWIYRELPDAREEHETVGTVPGPVRLKPARRCQSQNEVPTITNTALLKADCPGARNGLCYVAQDLLQFGF